MEELRLDVVGYEGLYQVSNLGRVKNLSYYNSGKCKIVTPNQGRYLAVSLRKQGIRKLLKIHRLVAKAFIPNLFNKPCVNHLDGDSHNNYVNNLERCTHSENSLHRINILGQTNSITQRQSASIQANKLAMACRKPVNQYSRTGEFIFTRDSAADAQRVTGIQRTHIGNCCKGTYKSAGGFKRSYLV